MYLYIIFSLLALLSFVELNFGKNLSKKMIIFPILIFFFLSFLRWEKGTDWLPYYYMFRDLNIVKYYKESYEILYFQLFSIVRYFTNTYTYMLLVQAVIIYLLNYYIIRKHSLLPMLSIFLWFSYSFASIFFVRQTLAMAFIMLSLHFIINRKMYGFLLSVLGAFLIHRSAVIFLPAYFIWKLNLSRFQIIAVVLISFGLTFFAKKLFSYFVVLDISIISEKSETYLRESKNTFGSSYSPFETMIRGVSYRLAIIVITLFFYKLYATESLYRGFFNLYLVGISTFIIFVPMSVALIRFSVYYDAVQIFLCPFIILYFKDKQIQNIILLIMVFYFLTRLQSAIAGYYDLYVPYKSIFNKTEVMKTKI